MNLSEAVIFHPVKKKVAFKPGTTILQTAINAKVDITHKCGGKGGCLTCKVSIKDQKAVSQPTKIELHKLGKELINQGIRLGCQTKLWKTTSVEVPESPLKAAIRKQLEKQNNLKDMG